MKEMKGKDHPNKGSEAGRLRTMGKAFCIGLRIKGPFSVCVSLLGFAASFLPVWTASCLRNLTDVLQALTAAESSASEALSVFGALTGLYGAQLFITNLQQYVNGMDEVKIERYLKEAILRCKCWVKYPYIENYDDFQKKIAFAEEFAGRTMAGCIGRMTSILQLLLAFFAAAVALWEISPLVVGILLLTSVPAAVLAYRQQDETFRYRAKWMEEGTMVIHYFQTIGGGHSLAGLQEIRHFGLFDYMKARWRAIADAYIGKKNRIMRKHVAYNTAADFLRSAVYTVILLATAWEIYRNPAMGLGAFTLVFTLSGQLQSVTGECLVGIMVLMQNVPYMQAFFALEQLERDPAWETSSKTAPHIPGGNSASPEGKNRGSDRGIIFEKVSFAYPGTEREVLREVSVSIKPGEKVAIVGENGSGKSTFISLLCGMFQPGEGRILIDGVDTAKDPQKCRKDISVVFQDFARYEATLRENITVSDRSRPAEDEELMELLRNIHADEVVAQQPHGLDETVGSFADTARDLSGGQWQKISIARAAWKKEAGIMVLDEPTSALDPVAEAQLYRDFTRLTGNRTTLLISHRLGITAVVDRILVFQEGEIVEDGSHRELMEKNGLYAEMYRAQAQWYV